MKNFFAFVCSLACFAIPAKALVVFGESNEDASVVYDGTGSQAEYSVVSVGGCSAVYLGNGWFITANHVGISDKSQVAQNSVSAKVTRVDTSLNDIYGVDAKLFYVENAEQELEYLRAVNVSSEVCDTLSSVTFTAEKRNFWGNTYDLAVTVNNTVTLVGAGYGRAEDSNIADATVKADSTNGVVRSGEASVFQMAVDQNQNPIIVTMAEAENGSAQALNRDSGSGMFVEVDGKTYLVGLVFSVDYSSTEATFGSFLDAELTYNTSGQPAGVDTSNLSAYSKTIGLNLSNYADTINTVIAVPEPAEYAVALGAVAILAVFIRRKFLS